MLIKCPECGGNVSDKAPACIHCGFPLNDIHKENTCLVDGAEYDMTELENLFHTLSDEGQKELRREASIRYQDSLKYKYSGSPENRETYTKIKRKIFESVGSHFNWWNEKGYLAYKFITTCIDHNFQYFEFNTADIPDPSKTVRCPKCGSTSVTTQERGYSIMWGVLGSTKKKNLCQKCGYTWWPGAGK